MLNWSVLDFVKHIRGDKSPLLIWVESGDNASSVLSKMVHKNVHRVYITDNLSRFLGVVSVTDIALMLC